MSQPLEILLQLGSNEELALDRTELTTKRFLQELRNVRVESAERIPNEQRVQGSKAGRRPYPCWHCSSCGA